MKALSTLDREYNDFVFAPIRSDQKSSPDKLAEYAAALPISPEKSNRSPQFFMKIEKQEHHIDTEEWRRIKS